MLNNNVLIVEDDHGKESVVFGKGIGFGLKKGDNIPENNIDRIFISSEEKNYLQQLIDTIPQEYFDLSVEIISYIEENMKTKLNSTIYITLTDHIAYIKERIDEGIMPVNSMKWEIKQYYPEEYNLSKKVVELLEDEFDCELNDDEVASIVLHIINAEIDNSNIHNSMESIRLIDQILQIIRYQSHLDVDDENINFQRLVTHVKFFIRRVLQNKNSDSGNALFEVVKQNYPQAYKIATKVKEFVENKLDCVIRDDEITYLTIHIQRILKHE